MEWMQVLTIVASTVGSVFVFYQIMNERINRMEEFHREDTKNMEAKFISIDEKWERLFERLLIQDKEQGNPRG